MGEFGQLAARELINDGLVVIDLFLVGIFGAFLWSRVTDRPIGSGRWSWYRDRTNQAAISFFVYFFGQTIQRSWTATLLWHFRHKVNPTWIEDRYPFALIGASIAFVGALCAARIFSPDSVKKWAWIVTAVVALAFAGVMALL